MDLLETFFEDDIWQNIIDKGVDKTINNKVLRQYCKPEARANLLNRIITGKYHIKPPKVVQIPKDNGKLREIYVNTQVDRLVLAGINQAYYKLFENRLSPACKAYRENMSCAKVVKEVCNKQLYGYKLDLSKYFDTVNRETINSALTELNTGSPLDAIIYEYYNTDLVYINGKLETRYKSLAQGCAVAAFLSNYVLRDVDNKMLSMCDYYCRYSDDMLLLGANADKALAVLKNMLSAKGLSLNSDKIEKINPWTEFKFLGFGVQGAHITISQKDFTEKKSEVKHACRLVQTNKKLSSEQKLRAAIRDVKQIFFSKNDPCYGWLYAKALGINNYERLSELDSFCKEHIRAAVTGKWNYTTNVNKVTENNLRDSGYVSLVQMAKLASFSRDVYCQEHLLHIKQQVPKDCEIVKPIVNNLDSVEYTQLFK